MLKRTYALYVLVFVATSVSAQAPKSLGGIVVDGDVIRFEREAVIEQVSDNALNVVIKTEGSGCKKEKPLHLGLSCICPEKEDGMCSITYSHDTNEARCGGETCCKWAVNMGPIIRPSE